LARKKMTTGPVIFVKIRVRESLPISVEAGGAVLQVDPARSRKMGGTGLGLAIVKHLVKAHGWTMQIEKRPWPGIEGQYFHILIFPEPPILY